MTQSDEPPFPPDRRAHSWWIVGPIVATMVALSSGLTGSSVFCVRDLGQFYYPLHVWYRRTVFAGVSPMWDPYVGFGQSAIADPARNLLFPPVIALRLLAPENLGFNLSVALPFPILAAGAYLMLRRRSSAQASALGASVLGLSGPILATGSFLNMSWAVAALPWILWAIDSIAERQRASRVAGLAVLVALQFLAGEPVTFAATTALALLYAVLCVRERGCTLAGSARVLGVVCLAYIAGACLAAPQALPLADAASRSARATGFGSGYSAIGSFHPLQLFECVAPWVFGDPVKDFYAPPPVLMGLNNGSEPIVYSVYLGFCPVLLAVYGLLGGRSRRWRTAWGCLAVMSTLWTLGPNTPLYTMTTRLVPFLGSLRFPSKLAVFVALAVAVLCATGFDALRISTVRSRATARALQWTLALAGLTGTIAIAAALVGWLAPSLLAAATRSFGPMYGPAAAGYLARALPQSGLRLAVFALCTGLLVWTAARIATRSETARWVLFALCIADLLVVNSTLNPTVDAKLVDEPSWVASTRSHPSDRIYVGPRIAKAIRVETDIDAPQATTRSVSDYPDMAERAIEDSALLTFPSRAAVRDSITPDQQALWPLDDLRLKFYFKDQDRPSRTRFLSAASVRYYVTPEPPSPDARPVTEISGMAPQKLYELAPSVERASVVASARAIRDPDQLVLAMLARDFDPRTIVLISADPPDPAGTAGAPLPDAARVTVDDATRVVVEANAGADGRYVLLTDSFDPGWMATVDGVPAPILKANGLFRSVRIASGAHTVVFAYNPRPFRIGLWIAGIAAAALALACLISAGRPGRSE